MEQRKPKPITNENVESPMDANPTRKITVKQAKENLRAQRARKHAAGERHEKKEVSLSLKQKLGRVAARTWSYGRRAYEFSKEKLTPAARRAKKFGSVALAQAGQYANVMNPHIQTSPAPETPKRRKLDDEQPSHPDAAPLGGEADSTPAVVDGEVIAQSETDDESPAEVVVTPEYAPSERITALFDPYEITTGENGEEIRTPKENGAEIQLFDTSYLSREEDDTTEPTPLQELTRTRAALAEASFAARKGRFFGTKKHQQALADTQEAYQATRDRYLESLLGDHDLTPREQSELTYTFLERETGALAGEEAQHYLTMNTDPGHMSRFGKLVDRYNNYSTTKKIGIGLGVSALVGATLFTTGIAAATAAGAAGATYGARAGMNMFRAHANSKGKVSKEAKVLEKSALDLDTDTFTEKYGTLDGKDSKKNRRKVLRASQYNARQLSHEMNAVAYAGIANESLSEYMHKASEKDQAIAVAAQEFAAASSDEDRLTIRQQIEQLDQERNNSTLNLMHANDANRLNALDKDRKRDRRDKVKVLATAAVGTAAGAWVGHLGHALAHGGGFDAVKDHLPWGSGNNNTPNQLTQPGNKGTVPGVSGGETNPGDTPPATNGGTPIENKGTVPPISDETTPGTEAPSTPLEASPEAKHLYGNFAGQAFELKLDAGDTVWGSLRSEVLTKNPGMSFQEADRITGNMVKSFSDAFAAKNPGYVIDYTKLRPGDTLTFNFSKK